MISSERFICPFDMPSTSTSNYKDETYKGALFVLALTAVPVYRESGSKRFIRRTAAHYVFYALYLPKLLEMCSFGS
jgi:hypothetical protein